MTAPNFKVHGQSSDDNGSGSNFTPTTYPSGSTCSYSSSYTTLAEYLWKTPFIFNGRFNDDTRKAILTECYQSLWQHDPTLMQHYFFNNQKEFLDAIHVQLQNRNGKEYPKTTMVDPSIVWHSNGIVPPPDLSNEYGRQCGYVFRKGEPIYRCRTCGLDDSSVFCSRCFHATNHDGHDVLFAVSQGSGGCCDCGDAEAWKIPLQCNIHFSSSSDNSNNELHESGTLSEQVPKKVADAIRTSLSAVLDFILDTFALGPEEMSLTASSNELTNEDEGSNKISVKSPDDPLLDQDDDVDMDHVGSSDPLFSSPSQRSSDTTSGDHSTVAEEYVCIAWNDEGHAFSHVLECLQAAKGCKWEEAKELVEAIHLHGRKVIATSTSIEQLRKIAAPLAAINLGVSIRTARDVYREDVCSLLIFWLKELVHGRSRFFKEIPNGDAIVRTILCEELCTDWRLRGSSNQELGYTRTVDIRDVDDEDMNEDLMGIASSTMITPDMPEEEDIEMLDPDTLYIQQPKESNPGRREEEGEKITKTDVASIDWHPADMMNEFQSLRTKELLLWDELMANANGKGKSVGASSTGKKVTPEMMPSVIQREFERRFRLDYLLLADLKLWKEMRVALRELYITSLIADTGFRKVLGKRLARNYARLAESFLLKDREPESSIILFSVQLLTVPSVADLLVNQYDFFGLICSSLTAFFLTDRLYLVLPSERERYPARVNCESRAFRTRRYFNAFHDLRYIMNVEMIQPVLAQDPLYLSQFLDLISMFQCMNAQICQKDAHVEYESEIWVNAFNVTLQIGKCCRQFAACFGKLSYTASSSSSDRIAATRTLVRAITRILKAIDTWGTEPDDMRSVEDKASSRKTRPATQQPGVCGPGDQAYHTFQLPYIDQPVSVLQYDITSQPVSFHHPLHWLLAFVLEHTANINEEMLIEAGFPNGFEHIFSLFKKADDNGKGKSGILSDDQLLPIIEYPIRTVAFSAQIRAGVWVRNGYGIRNQALHYRDVSLRENTFDADLFLLQLGLATIEPNKYLTTLMDRFGLVNWFLGDREHSLYDSGQSIFMVEELLNLLVICICEQTNVIGMDIESRIRREIIHNLCLNPITYSELIKRIPDRLHEHITFDHLLSKLGQFKPPVGVNDTGSYSLKDEYYDEIDPYFYHYSRNNREEAIDMLNKRWKDAHPSKEPHQFFLLPKCTKITNGAFRYLGDFLHSTVFTQMMAYVFWNVRMSDNHKSDTNLEQALYLILLALTDENNRQCNNSHMTLDPETNVDGNGDEDEEGDDGTKLGGFYRFVCDHYFAFTSDDHSQDLSLFDIMSIFRDDDKYQELHAQLDWIFEQLVSHGPGRTRRKVQKWKEGKALKMEGEDGASMKSSISELEAKKLAAKERQKKIMAQFAQAQSQFIEQNEGLYDEDEDEDNALLNNNKKETDANDTHDTPQNDGSVSRLCAYPTGTCIVCQEEVSDKSAPYGMLAFIQTSNIIREAHASQEEDILSKFSQNNGSLDTEWLDEQQLPSNIDNNGSMPGYPAHMNKTGLYTSTCSHLMHIKCFEVYCDSIDSRHTTQLTRNHPENRARNEFMCPLCKSLGNILLPVYWKGRKEMYPGPVLHNETFKYYNFLRSNIQPGIDRLKQAIINRSQRRRSNGSKLKEAFSTFVPSLRTTAPSGSIASSSSTSASITLRNEDEWQTLRRPPITNIELPTLFQPEGSTSTPIISSSTSASSSSASATASSSTGAMGNIYTDRRFGPFDSDIMHPSTSANLPSVSKMYVRVFEVISTIYQEICSDDSIRDMSINVKNIDLLWGLLGYTIAGVEIATRGQSKPTEQSLEDEENTLTGSLFDQIPPQTRMLLRILCDSILAYTCIMCHQEPGASLSSPSTNLGQTLIRVHLLALARLRQVFADIQVGDFAHLQGLCYERMVVYDNLPLLQDDPFMVLTELTFHGIPFAKMSVHILMRVLLLAELTKTVVSVVQETLQLLLSNNTTLPPRGKKNRMEENAMKDGEGILSDEQIGSIKSFTMFIMEHLKFTPQEAMAVYEKIGAMKLYALLQSFGLPFLRRTMILMIVRYGYIPSPKQQRPDANEFERILDLLWLPELPELIELKPENEQLISTWCSHHITESERNLRMQQHHAHYEDQVEVFSNNNTSLLRFENIVLDLPTPLQLIPLPMKLEQLIDESLRRVCTKCNSVPTDPAICLLCGTFVCAQSFCCAEDEEGECNLHRLECGGEIGLYLSVKRCVVILLYNGNGWFVNAPYLDPHGEVGQGFRRGKPQYLNRKRYNEIRKLWLQHNIPVYIARQIEASYDIGGWISV
ncbi:hypothetical protein BDA99DRAFT_501414 [Phascolomyces articulosus]|uniref:E3 ubiquitin-protein ligase n=1 Tax=Phascolomyces articulosus TaxID=60185 RepID=A0AAD5PHK6_9FUNG|nr:hypothetical protein BDA99DRAFT_501414 [Phascolomyces articulosus]